jgi:cytochrome c-type biogenesis protein CcmH/NrfG
MGLRRGAFVVVLIVAVAEGSASAQPAPTSQGKIVALNGRVEHTPAAVERFSPARILQPLFVSERVRTLEASRAAILFVDETQVKLNAGAVLTIRQVQRSGGGSAFELSKGEGWFRTKNPRSGLTIQTPAAAAAVRGTEINLRIGANDETVLTVVEGAAEFSNPQGSILVNAGEEGTAIPGQAPTKRVILSPDDAVQWTLYYPARIAWRDLPAAARASPAAAGFDRLRAGDAAAALQAFEAGAPGDIWSRLGASIAYLEAGDPGRARQALADDGGAVGTAAAERRAQLAAIALAIGDIAGARREIDLALASDPKAVRPLVLLSSIELRQNRPDEARATADRALQVNPESVGALVAASEAAQSRFDLDAARAYLDRALALDPADLHALVNRARIRFGTEDTAGARADADRAAAVSANDPQVRSLRGFIHLAEGRLPAAQADFEAASQADVEFGEPHLGLGLAHFRNGRVDDGLFEMLTATLLEPRVALYQSYLGKAYYQANRFPEGLSALASAKRLDPRDPTPWLYTSLYLRDQNQQVDALNELRHAMALNDHRAVYRSRLLLDRDLATKNVSLAEIYRQLGFEAWGAYEALNSLETDVTNASAHLFLAETYLRLPDRNEAGSSELLQYFLYAPVNRNSFNNFAEYTALLEQPRRQFTVTFEAGTRERSFGNVNNRIGNERYAHVAFFQAARQEGSRIVKDDDRVQGFYQGKLALDRRTDLFFSIGLVRDNTGAPENIARLFGGQTETPVILRQFTSSPNRTQTMRFSDTETTLGLKRQWRPGSALTASLRYDDLEQEDERPGATTSLCRGFDLTPFGAHSDGRSSNGFRTTDAQIQQAVRLGVHQLIVGQQVLRVDKTDDCAETLTIDATGETLAVDLPESGDDSAAVTSVRDEIQVTPWLHASVGVAYQRMKYRDISGQQTFDLDEWNPRVGVSARLSPTTVIRAAAFRQLNTHALGANIAPPTVVGFVTARNEFPTARRTEVNVSVEHAGRRAFVGAQGFVRDTTVPFLLAGGTSFIPDADARGTGGRVDVNWIAARRVTVFADNELIRFAATAFARYDNLARIGVNAIHPRGVFVRLTASHVSQRFTDTGIPGLPRSNFALADLEISYEFAGKRGVASLQLTNAFDREFAAVIEGITVDRIAPYRRAVASLRWRLW